MPKRPVISNRPLRVLESFPTPRPTSNPYVVMLKDRLEDHPSVDLITFSWQNALTKRYDVFHAHWPEVLVAGSTPTKKMIRQLFFAVFLLRLTVTRTAVVRTFHNVDLPSGIGAPATLLLRILEQKTTLWIRLNTSSDLSGHPYETILHGHYRDWFERFPRSDPRSGRLAFVGLIRRYKSVDTLVTAFRGTEPSHPGLTLYIGGNPSSEELAEEISQLVEADGRVELCFAYLTDAELCASISEAECVVLPYRDMHNSGTVLAVLSLDRPVLVPDNDLNRALAAEVGIGWVYLYTDRLTPQVLTDTLDVIASRKFDGSIGRPDLHKRTWRLAADMHLTAFRRAIALKQARASSLPK